MNLRDLQIKPTAKGPSEIIVKFGPKKKVAEKGHPIFLEGREEKEVKESGKLVPNDSFLLDLRESSLLNRDLILARLKKFISNPPSEDLEEEKVAKKKVVEEVEIEGEEKVVNVRKEKVVE